LHGRSTVTDVVHHVMDDMVVMTVMDRMSRCRSGHQGGRGDDDRHGGEETTHCEYSEVKV